MRWAFKIAYVGSRFHGFSLQPGQRTVEETLLDTLRTKNVILGRRECNFQVASRTDRGVHALGNVVAFDSGADPRGIIALVNRKADGIWFYAYASVDREFNPRWASWRWYRYYLPGELDLERLAEGASIMEGEHDFRSFSRGRQGGVCKILSIQCSREGEWIVLDVKADRFLRNMVRRMSRALQMHCLGILRLEDLQGALKGTYEVRALAPSEFLCLMDVGYEFKFSPFADRGTSQTLAVQGRLRQLESYLLGALESKLG